MKRFAALIDRLIYTRSRNTKLALIADYLQHTPDPDRGWAIAALTESLNFPAVKSAMVRALLATQVDEELFRLSRHFVGDTAETAALLWPDAAEEKCDLSLSTAVDALAGADRKQGSGHRPPACLIDLTPMAVTLCSSLRSAECVLACRRAWPSKLLRRLSMFPSMMSRNCGTRSRRPMRRYLHGAKALPRGLI